MKLELLKYLPESESKVNSILFIHGANHGAWCWKENFLPYFSSKGFPSYAASLRGHGESEGREGLDSFSLNDYVEDILDIINTLKIKPVLVGHSMGGALVQRILHLHQDKIKGAVLMASAPQEGMSKVYLRLLFTKFKEFSRFESINKGEKEKFPSRVFFSKELPEEKMKRYKELLQPESTRAAKGLVKRAVPKSVSLKVPILVLGSKADWFFTEKNTISIGKAYNTEPVIFSGMSHDMMLDPNWRMAADRIIDFLNKSVSERE